MNIVQQHLNSKTYVLEGHLLWGGLLHSGGYGQLKIEGVPVYTHRLAWEIAYGPIPEGIQVNHLCDTPPCILPWHLYLGTQGDNMDDKKRAGNHNNSIKTFCIHGHAFDDVNTYYRLGGGRTCRACTARNAQQYRMRKKALHA